MSQYVLLPPRRFTQGVVSLATSFVDATSRVQQYGAAVNRKQNDEGLTQLRNWLSTSAVPVLAGGEDQTPLTGARLVEMNEVQVALLKEQIPDAAVIPNLPLNLVRPVDLGAGVSAADPVNLWHLDAIGLTEKRQNGFTGKGQGVKVAVLDTGVTPVPEIAGKVAGSYKLDTNAWSVMPQPSADTQGHGTHVSGLICGNKVGVAPGAEVVDVVMIPQGLGDVANFILALEWIGKQADIDIMNMSAGIPGYHPQMLPILNDLLEVGVLPVIATGNEGYGNSRSPGNYRTPISVGAVDSTLTVTSFSSSSSMIVDGQIYSIPDMVAPGDDVYSCVMGGGYEGWSGTSMATPIVSGIAALLIEKHGAISVLDLMQELRLACVRLNPSQSLNDQAQGFGLATTNRL
jgi:subtilisin family serine protease